MATEHRSRKVLQDLSVNKQKTTVGAGNKENEKPSSATKRGTGFGIVSKPIDVGTKPSTKSIPAVPVFSSATSSSSVSTSTSSTATSTSKPLVVPGKGVLTGTTTALAAPSAASRSSSKGRKPLESKSGTKPVSKGTAPKLLTQLPSNSKSTTSTSSSSSTTSSSLSLMSFARKFTKFTSSSVPTESSVPDSGTMSIDSGPEVEMDPSLIPEGFPKEAEPGLEGSRGGSGDITADSEKDTSFRDSPEHLTKKQKEDSDDKMSLGLETSLSESTSGWKDDGEDAEMSGEGGTRATGHIESLAEVDLEDKNNPQMATDYIQDIMNYFRDVESRRQAKKNYMERQPDIDEDMREILVDWLIGVHSQFKLKVETLFLTVNMIDRFLERKAVHRRKLQLVGCTCMFLASKYEERHAPLITDFVYVSANNFTKPEVLEMEGHILNVLQFNLTVPSPYRFAQRYLRVAEADDLTTLYTQYLLELTLPKYEYLKYLPSQTAATAVYIALKTTKLKSWDSAMVSQTQYSEAALEPSIRDLINIANEKNPKCSVHRKFSSKKLQEVAIKIQMWTPTKDKISAPSIERSGSSDVLEERAF